MASSTNLLRYNEACLIDMRIIIKYEQALKNNKHKTD